MQDNIQKEEAGVIKKKILDYYHEGHVKSDPELYKKILHNQWKFFFYDKDGQFRIVDREEYMSWYDPKNVNEKLTWNTEFYNIDVTGNNAAVKLKIECEEVGFIDYFHLMKIDGNWWIVHKLSHPIK